MSSTGAFQNEISFCETSIRAAEDKILDRMGEADPLEKAVRAAETSLKQEQGPGGKREEDGHAAHPPKTGRRWTC